MDDLRKTGLWTACFFLLGIAALYSGCRCEEERAQTEKAPTAEPKEDKPNLEMSVEPPKPCKDCNIILITFDALRADHMGVYGYSKNTTPQMDAFAKEAYVFFDAMSQAGTTVISLPSLFTSKFPWTDELYQRQGMLKLAEEEATLAEILSAAGYDTAAVVCQRFTSSQFGYARGFRIYDEDFTIPEPPEHTLRRVMKVLPTLKKPFFFWVHFMPPHAPYQANKEVFDEFYKRSGDEPTVLDTPVLKLVDYYSKREPLEDCYVDGIKKLAPTIIKQIEAHYDGHVRIADDAFGSLMAELKKMKLLDDSAIFLGADHGEMLGEHKYIGHNRLSWPSLHVPLMVRLPDKGHSMLGYPVMNLDFFPTVLSLLSIKLDYKIRGKDLFDSAREDYFQLAEYDHGRAIKKGGFMLVERHPDTRLSEGMEFHRALFDLRNDPHETKNLIDAKPERAEELSRILNGLTSISASQGPDAGSPGEMNPKAEMFEQLKKLGYIK